MSLNSSYDVVIVGGGHNGLVAASYLGRAGLSVLVLERNNQMGGATQSACPFPGVDAKLSVYSYLVSLLPPKIISDLNLKLELRSRSVASYTPRFSDGRFEELLISNHSPEASRQSFARLPGGEQDYDGFRHLQTLGEALARVLWPRLLSPLTTRSKIKASLSPAETTAWDALIESPLGEVIEQHLKLDLVRGLVFTDAKIGISTHPHDPSLLQNRTYLYHILGQGTGEWRVPVGGMGTLTAALKSAARANGATLLTGAQIQSIETDGKRAALRFHRKDRQHTIDTRFVLSNAAPSVLDRLLGRESETARPDDEGSVVKINLLLTKLPDIRSESVDAADAFTGTFHIDEGYQSMTANYRAARQGQLSDRPSGEVYCHSLTDPSILSHNLIQQGYHTLTLFGLDMPYSAFKTNHDERRSWVLDRYLEGINRYTRTPIQDCLAFDANGQPCIEIKTPIDLEREIHLPQGNIFHNALSWPFVDSSDEAGLWGVETPDANVFLCGSGARRGGCVSGIPGHNAAMKVLETIGTPRD